MAGGMKVFGPTYNATKYVRLGIEGSINGNHVISSTLVGEAQDDATKTKLAGKVAGIKADGIGLAGEKGAGAVGLFVEDMGDMMNASEKASFYFRGGEYYISVDRMGEGAASLVVGDLLTTDTNGCLVKSNDGTGVVATVISAAAEYRMGNMYEHAGIEANGGKFVGIILHI